MASARKSGGYGNSGKRLYIRTFGCQMNVRDSEIILGMLQGVGFEQTQRLEDANVILFNTCSVRDHAEQRVWGQIGMLKKLKTQNSKLKAIGLVGCMAQNYQKQILRRFAHVDFVCGPANIHDIPDLIRKTIASNIQVLAVDKTKRPLRTDCATLQINQLKAYVSIMYGCNNFCSYCIVPYVRGSQRSRPLKHILDEVQVLAKRRCKEITLLGQNVNSYGKDLKRGINFVRLLENLDRITGLERIRFITSHPKDASRDMLKAMRDLPKVCEHLHLPLQAGSDKILKLMNRRYTLGDYLKLVDYLRRLIPNCSLTTDIIVGFPGENKNDFKKTVQAMKSIQFDEAFIFKYSPRPKTKAAHLEDDVSVTEKQQRNQALLALQEEISLKKNKSLLGKSIEVLTEGPGHDFANHLKKDVLQGRSRTNKVTLFTGKKGIIFRLVNVEINRASTHTLMGAVNGKNN